MSRKKMQHQLCFYMNIFMFFLLTIPNNFVKSQHYCYEAREKNITKSFSQVLKYNIAGQRMHAQTWHHRAPTVPLDRQSFKLYSAIFELFHSFSAVSNATRIYNDFSNSKHTFCCTKPIWRRNTLCPKVHK